MKDLTSNHLYRATAPLLTEDPAQAQSPKPQPPHKFWRAVWEFRGSRFVLELARAVNRLLGQNFIFLNTDGSLLCCGPIYASKEECETKELAQQHRAHSNNIGQAWFFLEAIKTDEHGAPL